MRKILLGLTITAVMLLIVLTFDTSEPTVIQKEPISIHVVENTMEETTTQEITTEVTTEEITTEETTEEPTTEPQPINKWDIELTDEEISILEQIVWLEAGNQSDEGIQAVAEVILNRMYSDLYPNDLVGVLSQRGQFGTWYNRCNAQVSKRVKKQVKKVLNGKTDVLPFETLYFNTTPLNSRVQAIIGAHYFCNA